MQQVSYVWSDAARLRLIKLRCIAGPTVGSAIFTAGCDVLFVCGESQ